MEEALPTLIILVATLVSFTLSASAGQGGSLILIPSLALVLGAKEAIALAALLLGVNNIFKIVAYRDSLPIRAAIPIVALISLGSILGASVLVEVPEPYVAAALISTIVVTLIAERRHWIVSQKLGGPVLALFAGATSGFSGTSGPLKGAALRSLRLDRAHMVGGISLASLFTDLSKAGIYARASLLGPDTGLLLLVALPLMLLGTYTGRRINQRVGERGYACLFWSVMAGYSIRVLVLLV